VPKQNPGQRRTIGRVMHEYKHGELEAGSGRKVRSPKQAVAIALSEAGASDRKSGASNRRAAARTREKERHGETAQQRREGRLGAGDARTRKALVEEAARRGIRGRTRMSKDELLRALAH
jgi:hypothetical protein